MILTNGNNTITFSLFSQFPELLCVMSTRIHGDLNIGNKPITNAIPFFKALDIPVSSVISMRQIHSTRVTEVSTRDAGSFIPYTDGIFTKENRLYLTVKAADCVPIFLYDPNKGFVGVVHSGWRGTLGKIIKTMISKFQQSGSQIRNIFVAIGPHIGGCCYTVDSKRAGEFAKVFSCDKTLIQADGKWHLDLGYANLKLIMDSGIPSSQIDAGIVCTSCENDRYFSYRKNKDDSYGEMLGVIGIKN